MLATHYLLAKGTFARDRGEILTGYIFYSFLSLVNITYLFSRVIKLKENKFHFMINFAQCQVFLKTI